MFNPVMVCSECGEPLMAKEVTTHPGPGARPSAAKRTAERNAKATLRERTRPERTSFRERAERRPLWIEAP